MKSLLARGVQWVGRKVTEDCGTEIDPCGASIFYHFIQFCQKVRCLGLSPARHCARQLAAVLVGCWRTAAEEHASICPLARGQVMALEAKTLVRMNQLWTNTLRDQPDGISVPQADGRFSRKNDWSAGLPSGFEWIGAKGLKRRSCSWQTGAIRGGERGDSSRACKARGH